MHESLLRYLWCVFSYLDLEQQFINGGIFSFVWTGLLMELNKLYIKYPRCLWPNGSNYLKYVSMTLYSLFGFLFFCHEKTVKIHVEILIRTAEYPAWKMSLIWLLCVSYYWSTVGPRRQWHHTGRAPKHPLRTEEVEKKEQMLWGLQPWCQKHSVIRNHRWF